MKTNAEIQKASRERRSHGGLFKKVEVYVHPDDKNVVKDFVEQLRKSRLNDQAKKALVWEG